MLAFSHQCAAPSASLSRSFARQRPRRNGCVSSGGEKTLAADDSLESASAHSRFPRREVPSSTAFENLRWGEGEGEGEGEGLV